MNRRTIINVFAITALALSLFLKIASVEASDKLPMREVNILVQSGVHNGTSRTGVPVFSHTIHVPGATWLRVRIADYQLGEGSYLRLVAQADGKEQRLDSQVIQDWSGHSAYFNGDTLLVELIVGPRDRRASFTIDQALAGEATAPAMTLDNPAGVDTLCGGDNRTPTTDWRTGRLLVGGVCTAWLISNGALLTAGHCADDVDDNDNLLDPGWATGIVEFQVPASTSSGGIRFAAPKDQYPVRQGSVVWDRQGSPEGGDWAVFQVNRNANASTLPHHRFGFYRLEGSISPSSITPQIVRVVGYGQDNTPAGTSGGDNAQTHTNQSSDGLATGRGHFGANIYYEYDADTMGGNSGGPIVQVLAAAYEPFRAVGIHTTGGCDNQGGLNLGTSFEVDALEQAIQVVPGTRTRYVDAVPQRFVSGETGMIFRPFNRIAEGAAVVPSGGILSIVAGTYKETLTISRPMQLTAPVGVVTIGP